MDAETAPPDDEMVVLEGITAPPILTIEPANSGLPREESLD
jgi:hypothetical protein